MPFIRITQNPGDLILSSNVTTEPSSPNVVTTNNYVDGAGAPHVLVLLADEDGTVATALADDLLGIFPGASGYELSADVVPDDPYIVTAGSVLGSVQASSAPSFLAETRQMIIEITPV